MGKPLTSGNPLRVGIVGCGKIVAQYLESFRRLGEVRLVAVADIDAERARAVAEEWNAGAVGAGGAEERVRAVSVEELLADPGVDLVLNLTIPAAHAEIALAAIAAGKHVYGEKPLAATTVEARRVLDAAAAAGVAVGCAPDTVLGTGIQTARKAIDDGLIGAPVAATATMVTPGHERWHPNPDFYYQPGGGPLLDMGPYYVTALVTLLGPVVSVVGAASHTRPERVIGSGPRTGQRVPVEVDTHVSGVLVHASGALSTLVMSFDAVATQSANIEVHGPLGTLAVPDPNHFDGETRLHSLGGTGWESLPVSAGYAGSGRGYGIADLALALSADAGESGHDAGQGAAQARADGELAYHVLDVMESLLDSAHSGKAVAVTSRAERPNAVPLTDLARAEARSA